MRRAVGHPQKVGHPSGTTCFFFFLLLYISSDRPGDLGNAVPKPRRRVNMFADVSKLSTHQTQTIKHTADSICKGRFGTDIQRLNFVGRKCFLCVRQTSLLHYARGLVDYADSAGGQELFREADVRGFSDYLCTSSKQGGLRVLPGAFGLGLAIFEQIGG